MPVRRLKIILSIFILIALGLYTLWPWLPFPGRVAKPRTIIFYGFSILGEAMNQGIFPAFQKQWKETTGEEVEFISSFAGSGTVANQLIMGMPAHLALLSLESDARRLSDAGVIAPQSWRRLPYRGYVILPALRGGLFTGTLLTFAHSLGEFGAAVMVSGNLRLRTQTAPLYRSDSRRPAFLRRNCVFAMGIRPGKSPSRKTRSSMTSSSLPPGREGQSPAMPGYI